VDIFNGVNVGQFVDENTFDSGSVKIGRIAVGSVNRCRADKAGHRASSDRGMLINGAKRTGLFISDDE